MECLYEDFEATYTHIYCTSVKEYLFNLRVTQMLCDCHSGFFAFGCNAKNFATAILSLFFFLVGVFGWTG